MSICSANLGNSGATSFHFLADLTDAQEISISFRRIGDNSGSMSTTSGQHRPALGVNIVAGLGGTLASRGSDFDPNSVVGQFWHDVDHFGAHRPILARVLPILSEFGTLWREFGFLSGNFGPFECCQFRAIFADHGATSANV